MGVVNWAAIGGLIADLVLISILVSTIYMGQKKGLVGVIFSIVSFIVAIAIVLFVYKPVAQMVIDKTDWDEKLTVMIEEKLSGANVNSEGMIVQDASTSLSDGIVNFINRTIQNSLDKTKETVIGTASGNIAIIMIKFGTMIVLFVVSKILLMFLKSVIELIAGLPFIRLFNEAGGIIYGVVKGFLIIYFVLAIASLLSPLISQWGIISAIEKSHIASRMYNNNILLNFIFSRFGK